MKNFLTKHSFTLAIVGCIIVGSLLRLSWLGAVPQGLGWDEAAIGYNGWSIWTTRRDEWLTRLPISFRSFGDYKAPFAIYANGPFTLLFGMSAFAVRLPFALAACLTLVIWWRLLELIREKAKYSQWFVLWGVAALAFSPWHMVFSRIAFESVISLFFVIFGVWLTLKALYSTKMQQLLFVLAGFSFVASLYTYHSTKIVVPLLVFAIAVIWWRDLRRNFRKIRLGLTLSGLALLPLAYDALYGAGATRAGDLIFFQDLSLLAKLTSIGVSIAAHLNPLYLFLGQNEELRHVTGVFGILLPGTLAFAVYFCLQYFFYSRSVRFDRPVAQAASLAVVWCLLGMVPGFFSAIYPHANRTLLALPGLVLLASFGFEWVVAEKRKGGTPAALSRVVISAIITIDILWFISFTSYYFTQYPAKSATAFQAGYAEAVALAATVEKNQPPYETVENILISSSLGQPYIYVLFYEKIRPIAYHSGRLVRYLFPDKITIGDVQREHSLLLFTSQDPLFHEMGNLPVEAVPGRNGTFFYSLNTEQVAK